MSPSETHYGQDLLRLAKAPPPPKKVPDTPKFKTIFPNVDIPVIDGRIRGYTEIFMFQHALEILEHTEEGLPDCLLYRRKYASLRESLAGEVSMPLEDINFLIMAAEKY